MVRHRAVAMIVCLAAALVLGGPAASQPVSQDARAAALELLSTMRMVEQFKLILPVIMKQLKPAIAQGRPEVERELDAMMPLMIELMNKRTDELVEATVAVYVRHFTADEMRHLIAFYKQPVGQKFLEKMPVVFKESFAIGQKFGQSIAAELRNRLVDELRKRGHKI